MFQLARRHWFLAVTLFVAVFAGQASTASQEFGSPYKVDHACKKFMSCSCDCPAGVDTVRHHYKSYYNDEKKQETSTHMDVRCTKCNSKFYCPAFKGGAGGFIN